ncbi:MAG: MoxR family ATPase [Pseudomonadota bacterium]
MSDLGLTDGQTVEISASPRRMHVFAELDIQAVEAALGAQRPLLLLGEPGIGKSQLAEAVAMASGWHFVSKTVDALTEPGDLMWQEDAVSRLAEAQLAGASHGEAAATVRARLERHKFVMPGVLWSAFDPEDAERAGGPKSGGLTGIVALIDEIDKAESAVPNGLLEALGAGQFTVPGRAEPVRAVRWPLVIITSNDERPLPKAFIRRCIVHHMIAPTGEDFIGWLVRRGRAYYPDPAHEDILLHVAQTVNADRETARRERILPLPGLAEYLDLLRALYARGPQDIADVRKRTEQIGHFFLRKGVR